MKDTHAWKESIGAVLPPPLFRDVERFEDGGRLEEIRVRVNRPVQYVLSDGERLSAFSPDEKCCDMLFENICEHSVYAREDELKNCFVTLAGGFRVGVCGKAVVEEGALRRLSRVTGFNVRIAREFLGCSSKVVPMMLDKNGDPLSTLLIAAPGVGKTTMLRDIARQFSSGGSGVRPRKVCIADERSEITGAHFGVPLLDVGPRTDVMDGCPKAQAMRMMIRTMSPQLIVTDEIGSEEDALAVGEAAVSGVAVVASVHARNLEEARAKHTVGRLIADGRFSRLVELSRIEGRVYERLVI